MTLSEGTIHPLVGSGRVVASLEPREGGLHPGCPISRCRLDWSPLCPGAAVPRTLPESPCLHYRMGPSLDEGLTCSVPAASPCGPNSCHTPCPAAHSVPATRGQTGLSFLWQPGCPHRAAAEDAHHLHPESSREHIRRSEERKGGLEGGHQREHGKKDLGVRGTASARGK